MNIVNILKSLNVLYIEDDKVVLDSISTILRYMVAQVFTAENGKDALDIFRKEKIDIILTDIDMPKLNGIEFAKRVRQINEIVPIIIITSYKSEEYLFQSMDLKLEDYIIKPINYDKLVESLSKCAYKIEKDVKVEIFLTKDIIYNKKGGFLINQITKEKSKLTEKEMKFMNLLAEDTTQSVTYESINSVLGFNNFDNNENSMRSLISKLRKKIGKNIIKNISGLGYKLEI